jgi:hypothetical protein
MNALIQRIVEAPPIDYTGEPDYMAPDIKRKVTRRDTGHNLPAKAKRSAFQPGEGKPSPDVVDSWHELAASDGYVRIIKKLKALLGAQMPTGPRAPGQIQQMFMQSAMRAMQWERGHERELEQLAIQLVLSFDEHKLVKDAYEKGAVKIIAKLTHDVDKGNATLGPEEPEEEVKADLEIAEIAVEYDAEVGKRRMINAMIQGAAIGSDHSYALVRQQLERINPQIINTYALMMAGAELNYWTMPEQTYMSVAGGGAAGMEDIDYSEEGVPTIRAQAVVFPVLVQELTKGIMEYLADNRIDEPETRKYAQGQADTLGNEQMDINLGPKIWRQFISMFPDENARTYMPIVMRELASMPAEQFHATLNHILQNDPEGFEFIQTIIREVDEDREREAQGGEEPPEESNYGGPNDGGEPGGPNDGGDDDTDAWKHESKAQRLIGRFLN